MTLDEVKNFLGIEGTEKDSSITALIPVAESVVLDMLGLESFLENSIAGERVEILNPRRFFLKKFPVKIETVKIFDLGGAEITTGFFQDSGGLKEIRIGEKGSEKYIRCGEFYADYTAGWVDDDSVPSEIKQAIALVLAGFLAEQDSMGGNIESYKIYDIEDVKFRSSSDMASVKMLLKKYR